MSYVHFVISGECMILQCLKIMVSQKNGVKTFELTDIAKEGSKSIFQDLSNTQLLQILNEENGSANKTAYDINEIIASDDNETNKQSAKSRDFKQIDIRSMEIRCGLAEPSDRGSAGSHTQISEINSKKTADYQNEQIVDTEGCENIIDIAATRSNISEQEDIAIKDDVAEMRSSKTEYLNTISNQKSFDNQSQRDIIERSNIISIKRFTLQSLRDSLYGSSRSAEIPPYQRPTGKIENHFIDVGSLTFGSIFGLGEKLEHRVIMARTTVQCLMIPRFWLLEKDQNPGNIWQRRRFYLDTTIPSRQTLFKDFLYTRQWQKFKTKLIQSHLNPNSIANPTRVQDIPIICRIVEARDD
ncbi:hypothetical protein FF38_01845 [Lucilia cuprina]|uniref:Uncharacterized protein n=1 Tax=Lucilia cuprina TaxID=7375 RepID=A0A0L0BQB1_LUCCU|nr:hypothetical protein FF38_01845 [Lucilia cuprina]